jgi:K+-sensing histidine kinase KdpD
LRLRFQRQPVRPLPNLEPGDALSIDRPKPDALSASPSGWGEYGLAVGVLGVLTGIGLALPASTYLSIGLLYLLAVILLSLRVGRGPVVLAGLLSAVTWDYLFIPPHFRFAISNPQDRLMFGTYFPVALIAGQLAARIRAQAARDRRRTEAAKLLAESEKLHRALLDSVSHELRTPLAVITAALENLDGAAPAMQAGLVGEMRVAARRLNRLVGNLLDQTRLETGALRPRLDWCDARDLVNAAIDGNRDALAGHPLTVEMPDDLPSVRADFTLTEQALGNLLLNAAVHTPPATPIRVTAGVEGGSQRAFFSVADHGPGLPPAIRGQLFKKFVRGETARAGGLGLGLAIVGGLVAAQGGEVGYNENPGGGARFTIYLPHVTPQAAESE